MTKLKSQTKITESISRKITISNLECSFPNELKLSTDRER